MPGSLAGAVAAVTGASSGTGRETALEVARAIGTGRETALEVARAIVACARRPRAEVYPCAPARLLVGLTALAPRLADAWVARAAKRAGRP